VSLTLNRGQGQLDIAYDNGDLHHLDAEYLRVMTPSAADRGHGAGPGRTVAGKGGIGIGDLTPIGRYAVRLHFSDGHQTGLYTWEMLHRLGADHATLWADYLKRLKAEGLSRNADA
jgi:DUF971 family protein